jgi:hypothetical protein
MFQSSRANATLFSLMPAKTDTMLKPESGNEMAEPCDDLTVRIRADENTIDRAHPSTSAQERAPQDEVSGFRSFIRER